MMIRCKEGIEGDFLAVYSTRSEKQEIQAENLL